MTSALMLQNNVLSMYNALIRLTDSPDNFELV